MMALTIAFAACVRGPSRPALDGPVAMDGHPIAIRFDNVAPEHVHVYLIATQRQWLLGRVPPGARATLRVPKAALARSEGFVQLAVIRGERITLQAARHPHAMFTIAQPASAILSQRWMFVHGQLTSLPLQGARMRVDRQ
jgi:hypothetical protein